MSDVYEPICVERILVSLDSSAHSFAGLQAAVDLARHYDAALQGVFVEDITLLSLAEMPFRQEVGEYSAIVREISTDGMTRGIFVQSKWVIRTFRKLINQTDLKGDIAVLRGNVLEIIEKESEKCDLLIIGKTGTNPLGLRRLGSTTKALIRKQQKSLLLVEEGNRLGYPMFVFYDTSPQGKISLETARDLLDPGETLMILLNADEPDELSKNKSTLKDWAVENQVNVSIQTYKTRAFKRFLQMISGLKTGLFILPYLEDQEKRPFVEICLRTVSLPILLVRAPTGNGNEI